nr:PREDICTED: epsin-2 isoform X1 [Lepisosteus oculatus]XP_015216016.1 PREDICTED: epsin-2 isoform X1 [Lepisosteus oculatus]
MPSSSIRRQMKNIVNNYSEAEKKVREATSNDPWGPSSSLMSEIADLTYNVVAFSEIMSMIWKRLNDHGKNWRHVYKALTLLDYLIKTGSERVAQQCKENIFAIQTLKDFQYVDRDGKDQGINVREKSKQLVFLLKDDDRLKGERSQALKTKERMAQVATGVGSNSQIHFGRGSSQPNLSTSYSEEYGRSGGSPASYHGSTSPHASSELEQARPQTSGEEELQLQLALAMSREAAEQEEARGRRSRGRGSYWPLSPKEERMRRGDDLRLQMALEESRKDSGKLGKKKKEKEPSVLMDLMDILPEGPADQTSDPWGGAAAAVAPDPWRSYGASSKPIPTADPWGASSASATPVKSADPWGSPAASAQGIPDPWVTGSASHPKTGSPGNFDPFSTLNGTSRDDFSEFDSLRSSSTKTGDVLSSRPSASASPDMFDLQRGSSGPGSMSATTGSRKTPESFLGPNAALVNLDSLVSKPVQPAPVSNPFLMPGAAPPATAQVNPFQVNQPQPPTLNQMRVSPMMGMSSQSFGTMPTMGVDPLPAMGVDPLPLPTMPPPGSMTMVPMPGMAALAPMGHMVPGMAMSMPGPMPQPLMSTGKASATTAAQGGGTTNPFLL